jgi:hypothetical protein
VVDKHRQAGVYPSSDGCSSTSLNYAAEAPLEFD